MHCSRSEIEQEVIKEIVDLIDVKPNCILGLATGSTPLGVYKGLVNLYNRNEVSFKEVKSFNLDEYIGLEDNNSNSYRYFMNNNFFNHIDIKLENTHIPNCLVKNDIEAQYYDDLIENEGGIDLQLLGLGSDGHIGFNEPNTSFDSLTHITNLSEKTINDNSRFFNSIDEVPKQAITMGLKTIMKAKRIILIVYGKNKEEILNRFLKEDINEDIPCSILKKHHDVTLYIEEDINIY